MKIIFPIVLTIIYTILIFIVAGQTGKLNIRISEYGYLNFQVNYQLILLGLAFLSLLTSYFSIRKDLKPYYQSETFLQLPKN